MTKFALLFFKIQCCLHASSAVYFTMTNVHMILPLDATSYNSGISLGQMYATSDTPMQTKSTNAKSSEEELVFAVVNASGFIDISEYSGRVFLQKDWFKQMKKDLTNTVAISASIGSSTSITSFTLSLTKSSPQEKTPENRSGASIGSFRFPSDCSKVMNDLCFWSSVTYRIYENENGTILGSLSPSYFPEVCVNYTVKYTIKDTNNFALLPPTVEEPAWRLFVHAPLNRDATYTEHYQFNHKRRARISGDILDLPVTCWVETGKPGNGKGSKRFNATKRLEIHVLDRNDNAPMAQYTDIKIYLEDNRVKEGHEIHHDKLLFIDRDSLEVNTYDIRILNDTERLLEPRCTPYAVDHHVSNLTALHCKLVFRRSTQMPTSPYTIIIQINDTSLLNGLNASHVQLPIQIISHGSKDQVNISSKPLAIYPKQFIEIYRSAAPFARLTQPKTIPANVGRFRIMAFNSNKNNASGDVSDKNHNGCFGVTPDTGILFVHNVALLRIASNMRLNIQWINGSNMQDHDELTVHIINEPTPTCTNISAGLELNISDMVDNWNFCSNYESFRECESQTCGLSTGGYASIENIKKRNGPPRCQWRGEKSPGEESTPHYATCTPDLLTCPDGVCDELEDLHHLICPQDCTTSRVISTITNDNKRGIKIAAGICKCDYIDNCYCNIKDKRKKNTVKSDSRTIGNHSDSSPNASVSSYNSLNRHTDHHPTTICGTTCIIGLTAATIFILLSLTGAVLYWKLGLGMAKVRRRRRSSKYSDDIPDLLSAQLSDYVERNNGASPTTLGNSEQQLMLGQHTGMGVTLDMGNGVIGIMIGSRLIPPPDPKWEFPRSQLIIEQTLGEGEFGRVLRAKAKDITGHPGYTTVAVKTLKDDARDAELADLMSEYELLKGVCHPNVIRLLGASTVPGGPIYLIMEFAEFGSLRSYIRRTRHLKSESHIPDSDRLNPPNLEHYDEPKPQPQQEVLTSKDILSFAWQISKGMAYLTDIKLVHRDLAARNVLVASGKICKISDFGLTRDIYEDDAYFKRSKGRVPVKWMAPESLSDHIYTTKSDIWSFGVLIWELVTLGATPYPGIPVQNLFHVLKNGYRMERPDNCSPAIYRIMRLCWESGPDRRPTFMELALQWETMLEQDIEYLDLTPDAIHNRSYFCTLLSDDNNESDSTTILNPAFSPITQPRSQTDFSKILNNEEQLNLEKNQQSSLKHGESSKFHTTSSTIVDKSNNNNNNTINKSNPYSNTPNLNSQQAATIFSSKTTENTQHQNNITAEERDALIADNRIVEGYETPVKVNQKSRGNRTPTNEHPQYYTDMTVGNNGSGGSKQLLPCGNGNTIADFIDTN